MATLMRRDVQTSRRIHAAVRRFATQNVGDVRKLIDRGDTYRLRVGDWRVVFTFEDDGQTVVVLRVVNRRDAYR
jgi:mRNA interferase RelE/StbE